MADTGQHLIECSRRRRADLKITSVWPRKASTKTLFYAVIVYSSRTGLLQSRENIFINLVLVWVALEKSFVFSSFLCILAMRYQGPLSWDFAFRSIAAAVMMQFYAGQCSWQGNLSRASVAEEKSAMQTLTSDSLATPLDSH